MRRKSAPEEKKVKAYFISFTDKQTLENAIAKCRRLHKRVLPYEELKAWVDEELKKHYKEIDDQYEFKHSKFWTDKIVDTRKVESPEVLKSCKRIYIRCLIFGFTVASPARRRYWRRRAQRLKLRMLAAGCSKLNLSGLLKIAMVKIKKEQRSAK